VTFQEALPSSPDAETAPEQAVSPKPMSARKVSPAQKEGASAVPEKVS
jgi:hypothetical protein